MRLELHLSRPDELQAPGALDALRKAVDALEHSIAPDLPKLAGDGEIQALNELERILTDAHTRHVRELATVIKGLGR